MLAGTSYGITRRFFDEMQEQVLQIWKMNY